MGSRAKSLDIGSTKPAEPEEPLLGELTQDRRARGGGGQVTRAGLEELAGNPANPRTEMGDLEELAESLRARGQLQPITVISRKAFVQIKPGHEHDIDPGARWVVLYGNRRLAAARLAGLEMLKIDVAPTPEDATVIRASALVENIHRKNLEPLEEAAEVESLVEEVGSAAEAARQLGLSTAWVSQRRALLSLTPPLKDKLRAGELKVKEARSLGRLPETEQFSAWERSVNPVNDSGQDTSDASDSAPEAGDVNPVNATQGSVSGQDTPAGEEDSASADTAPKTGNQRQRTPSAGAGQGPDQPVQLTLELEWEPTAAASEILAAYGPDRASALAEAIMDQL